MSITSMSKSKKWWLYIPAGEDFVLHHFKTGKEIRLRIPQHDNWHWGQMPDGTNYVSNGIGIHFIKETYEEYWAARCDAYNRYYRLGKYMH